MPSGARLAIPVKNSVSSRRFRARVFVLSVWCGNWRNPQPRASATFLCNGRHLLHRFPTSRRSRSCPFANMSSDPEQDYFADGMVEDIITALSRFKEFFVIARNSSFTYKGRAVDVKQVGRELGVRYVLEGSVRKVADRVRITGQLIDASTGVHLWADRFDGGLDDIFDLQDQITGASSRRSRRRWKRPRSSVPSANPPRASMPTRSICGAWPALIAPSRGTATGRASKRLTRHCASSTTRSNSTRILPWRMAVPPLVTPMARASAGFQAKRTKLPK